MAIRTCGLLGIEPIIEREHGREGWGFRIREERIKSGVAVALMPALPREVRHLSKIEKARRGVTFVFGRVGPVLKGVVDPVGFERGRSDQQPYAIHHCNLGERRQSARTRRDFRGWIRMIHRQSALKESPH